MRLISVAAVFGVVAIAWALPQSQSPPVVPPAGELHIPPSTRVIKGTVKAANGSPVSKAAVLLKDTKTLQVRSYITEADGQYHFYGLSTDVNYEVRAQAGDLTSPTKQISVFDSQKVKTVDLKIKDKKKSS